MFKNMTSDGLQNDAFALHQALALLAASHFRGSAGSGLQVSACSHTIVNASMLPFSSFDPVTLIDDDIHAGLSKLQRDLRQSNARLTRWTCLRERSMAIHWGKPSTSQLLIVYNH
eukprot:963887-Pelagomonas_calceolata.AAC.1